MMKARKNISRKISLNGKWNYLTDPPNKLSYNSAVKKYSSSKLPEINIPSNWQLEGLNNYSGAVWFFKKISIPEKYKNNLSLLEFNGVDYITDVWLNNKYLGNHEGYFQQFHFNVSKHLLIESENLLVVKVNSPKEEPGKLWPSKKRLIKGIFNHHDCRPGGWSLDHGQDQNTGGIWNEVFIKIESNIFIGSIKITSRLNWNKYSAQVLFSINSINNFTSLMRDKIRIMITSPEGEKSEYLQIISHKPGKNKHSISIKIDKPFLWWVWDLGKPELYSYEISSEYLVNISGYFGIREVLLDNKSTFYLNGKRLFLRGTNVIPEQMLSSLNRKRIKKQVELIKAANINIIRMHAHVNRKEYYEECDRQGILVWQDFALQWTYDESPGFATNAARQIKDMVTQLYNHPSIVFWCCHNEPGKQIKTLDPALQKAVLSEDKSRIVRLASNYEEHAYDGWYWGDKEHFAAIPMGPLVTEFGAQALPAIDSLSKFIPKEKQFPPYWNFWKYHNFQYEQTFHIAGVETGENIESFIENSQSYQASLLKTAIDFYRRERFSQISGIFQFMLVDCWPSITWSVVDYYGKKKKGYDTLRKCYQPLYVSINLRQQKYFRGQKLNIDIWVINDFHKLFNESLLIFKINNKVIGKIEAGKIEVDSKKFLNWKSVEVYLPKNIIKGRHTIYTELIHNRKSISFNDFDIEIME
jgi:beta-mannosidase